MLLEINVVVYTDSARGYEPCGTAIINTDKIVDITHNGTRAIWFVDLGIPENRHVISAAEMARIKPLLMPTAQMASDVFLPILSEEWHSKHRDLVRKWVMADMTSDQSREDEIVSQRRYQDLVDYVRHAAPASFTATEEATLRTLLSAHLNADTPKEARGLIANTILDFAEGVQRDRYAGMAMIEVLKEFGASALPHEASALPADVIAAYKNLTDVKAGKYTYTTSDHRAQIEFDAVMRKHIPADSEDAS